MQKLTINGCRVLDFLFQDIVCADASGYVVIKGQARGAWMASLVGEFTSESE